MRRNDGSTGVPLARCAHIHPPYAAPAMATRKSSASNAGEVRCFGFVSGRAGCRTVGACARVVEVGTAVTAACAPVETGWAPGDIRAAFGSVCDDDIVDSISRLKARSRAD